MPTGSPTELDEPRIGGLTAFAAVQQRRFDALTSPEERKARGHFGTPPVIAEFMADMFVDVPDGIIRILDPGAGVGTLSTALCQRILRRHPACRPIFELWESDPALAPYLSDTMRLCQSTLRDAGIEMQFTIRPDDFILANAQDSLFGNGPTPSFHLTILNPPYFKVRKESAHARAMAHVVHGQPNIYAFFMTVAADLLLPDGEMVAITPRSYFNGPYFTRFRKWFFDRLSPRQIHIFESRTEAFQEDAVLQENVILRAEKSTRPRDILLTQSAGREFEDVRRTSLPYAKVIDDAGGDHVIRVAASGFEQDIVSAMQALPSRFRESGLEVSTGPVVSFRATEFLRHERASDTAPLLWMHNVRPFVIRFPPRNGKPAHIRVNDASRRFLLPAKTYVLLKRFTAKEERRRLVAGIMTPADSYSEWVGLENHLNYVYRRGKALADAEAAGLAAFFNSAFVDFYFRTISGNTQVNAAELRAMPMPDQASLERIGAEIRRLGFEETGAVERAIGHTLGLPRELIDRVIEADR